MGTGARRGEKDSRPDLSLDWPRLTGVHQPTISGEDTVIGWAVPDEGMRPAGGPEPAGQRSPRGGETSEVADSDTSEAAALRAVVDDLRAENADLRAANAALRHRLGQRPLVAARGGGARKRSVSRRD